MLDGGAPAGQMAIRPGGAGSWASRLAWTGRASLATTLLLAAVYLLLAALLPTGGFYGGDQGVKYAQVEALAQTGELAVATVGDPLSVFRSEFTGPFYLPVGDHYQAKFSPIYAFLVLPFYRLAGVAGLIIPSILGALLAAYAAGRIGTLLGARLPWLIVLATGLASPFLFYALVLWEHALSAGMLTLACYWVLRGRTFEAGGLAALAAWLRPEAYLFGPAMAMATMAAFGARRGARMTVSFAVGMAAGLLPWWLFNWLTVGSPLGLHVRADFAARLGRLQALELHLLPMGQRKWLLLLLLILALALLRNWRPAFPVPVIPTLWAGAAAISLLHFLDGQVGISLTDVFPFAFASLGCLPWKQEDRRLRLIWWLAITGGTSTVLLIPDNPGLSWGPRFLLGIYPLLVILGCLSLERVRQHGARAMLVALLALSLLFQSVGVRQLNDTRYQLTQLNTQLLNLEPKAVATAIWWVPQLCVPTLQQLRWYGVVEEGDLESVVSREEEFWWIWTRKEPVSIWDHPIQSRATLPAGRFHPVSAVALPYPDLEAVLYRVR